MILKFNMPFVGSYHSNSQKIRVMSEEWVGRFCFCAKCGSSFSKFKNNMPNRDFCCPKCGSVFELKSKMGRFSKTIVDGSYFAMMENIRNGLSPNMMLLEYGKSFEVRNLIVVPNFYITKNIIIKRPPLREGARRAGWIGCNIRYGEIPNSGKLFVVRDGKFKNKSQVIENFNKMSFLEEIAGTKKKWLMDILKCLEKLNMKNFSLNDIYSFENFLRERHPLNKNIKAKIRQQLQILRDSNYLRFIGNGNYELLQ